MNWGLPLTSVSVLMICNYVDIRYGMGWLEVCQMRTKPVNLNFALPLDGVREPLAGCDIMNYRWMHILKHLRLKESCQASLLECASGAHALLPQKWEHLILMSFRIRPEWLFTRRPTCWACNASRVASSRVNYSSNGKAHRRLISAKLSKWQCSISPANFSAQVSYTMKASLFRCQQNIVLVYVRSPKKTDAPFWFTGLRSVELTCCLSVKHRWSRWTSKFRLKIKEIQRSFVAISCLSYRSFNSNSIQGLYGSPFQVSSFGRQFVHPKHEFHKSNE